jgi:hypothetical protein
VRQCERDFQFQILRLSLDWLEGLGQPCAYEGVIFWNMGHPIGFLLSLLVYKTEACGSIMIRLKFFWGRQQSKKNSIRIKIKFMQISFEAALYPILHDSFSWIFEEETRSAPSEIAINRIHSS